jgi:photosystem II stability/assembly factor-like uncharacterized protein
MTEITAYMSPNGQNTSEALAPATRLQVATIQGVATLTRKDPTAPWVHASSALTDLHIGALLHEPVSGKLFAGAHEDQGIWVSDDGEGRSWRPVSKGPQYRNVYALAARRSGSEVTLYAGTQPAALYRSSDFGETWVDLGALNQMPERDKWSFPGPPHIPHVKSIAVHPTQARTVFALVEQGGLFRSDDDGESFTELKAYSKPGELAYRDVHRLLINPDRPHEFFLATGEGLYRSVDAGASFTHLMKRGETIGYPDHVFFDPFNRRTLFMAGTAKSPNEWMRTNRADPVVVKSTDYGDSWAELSNGISKPVDVAFEGMCQHIWRDATGRAGGYMLALASASGRVWTTENAGDSWIEVAGRIAPVSKDHHYLPFLPAEERQRWIARRQARTSVGARS